MKFTGYEHLGKSWQPINNTLSEAIYKRPFTGAEMRFLECIKRKTYGYPREDGKRQDRVWISVSELSQQIGLNKTTVRNCIRSLAEKKVILVHQKPCPRTITPGCYGINSKIKDWQIEPEGESENFAQHRKNSNKKRQPDKKKKESKTCVTTDSQIEKTYVTVDPQTCVTLDSQVCVTVDSQVLGHAPCNHAAGSSSTKIFTKDLYKDPLTPKSQEREEPVKNRDGFGVGEKASVEDVIARKIFKRISETYHSMTGAPHSRLHDCKKLVHRHRAHIPILNRAIKKAWEDQLEIERSTGKKTFAPWRVLDVADRLVREELAEKAKRHDIPFVGEKRSVV